MPMGGLQRSHSLSHTEQCLIELCSQLAEDSFFSVLASDFAGWLQEVLRSFLSTTEDLGCLVQIMMGL